MTNIEPFRGAVLLRGTIANLKREKRSHDFILSEVQQHAVGATAVGAAALGMGAAGISLANMAMNSDEEAEWVEFELDGKQMQGWMWLMPMRNGDTVEIVAERIGDERYIAYAVKRDGDEIVAVYPHATVGRKAHYRYMTKLMLWSFFVIYSIVTICLYWGEKITNLEADLIFEGLSLIGGLALFGILFYRATRKMMGFVYMAEAIFRTYGWPDVENIDLRKTSREHRRENKLPNYGRLYFRYK
ncbi:putative type VI secretion system effector [Paraburkholderia sp. BR10936]|uniref:putative type VI secretion system effector n=1 Tax=Paraburkholderia sp. BR10936 TaxID=3236993 RepID=UPI0034D2C3E0